MIYLLLIVSIVFNLLFFLFDISPWIKKRFEKKHNLYKVSKEEFEKKIKSATKNMLFSNQLYMTMVEKKSFITWVSFKLRGNKYRTFVKYSYPRAFLFWGVLKYYHIKQESKEIDRIKIRFDELFITNNGQPKFQIDKVDQTVFAQVALELYKQTADEKYKTFVDKFYNYLISLKSDNGIILYRYSSATQYVDILGMISPFLIDYGLFFDKKEALDIAYTHMDYWIENGIDSQSHLPFHCIHLKTNIRVGPTNWGRGIGWYGLALAYIISKTDEMNNPYYNKFIYEMKELMTTLNSLRNKDSLWGQFPGNPKGNGLYFDASASLTYLYMDSLINKSSNFEKSIKKFIDNDGFVDFTSGDTEGINQYSRSYSKSEFSQGMLLLYLSELKKQNI